MQSLLTLTWIVRKNGNVLAGFTTREHALDYIKEQDFSDDAEFSIKYED